MSSQRRVSAHPIISSWVTKMEPVGAKYENSPASYHGTPAPAH